MELSKRLKELVSLIDSGICAADVGCDHGYVSIYLAENNIFEHVIAMDIRTGPLQSAENNIRKYRLDSKIETRLSDGIDQLRKGEADTLICAGMGGELIIHILSQNLDLIGNMKQLILQPQSEIYKVRKFIRDNRFKITAESMIKEDGKYYPMMRVERSEEDCVLQMENGKHLSYQNAEESEGDFSYGVHQQMENSNREFYQDEEKIETLRQQVEDEYGPILLKQKNKVLEEYLEKELRITKELIVSLEQQLKLEERKEKSKEILKDNQEKKRREIQKENTEENQEGITGEIQKEN